MAGEFEFVEWIRHQSAPGGGVIVPVGDDLAAVRWPTGELLLAGVDQVADGVHFDAAIHSPRAIGRKVMNRNLSDCAAMGCLPVFALTAVCLPRGRDVQYARELHLGLRDAADPHGCRIIGGDTSSWEGRLVMSVTILGRSAGVAPVTRGGARVGDHIFVSGPLGGSMAHRMTGRADDPDDGELGGKSSHQPTDARPSDADLARHMTFEPRVALGTALARAGATAMIDLSDGLSRDIRHILDQSGVGAIIEAEQLPIHADARRMNDSLSPLEHALHDGEDYELLFTGPPQLAAVADGLIDIGRITADRAVLLSRGGRLEALLPRGWEHAL
jgi:thiamine-monophosphate kinase